MLGLLLSAWLASAPAAGRVTAALPDGRQVFATLIPEQSALAPHVAAKFCFGAGDCLLLPNGSTSVRGIAVSPGGEWAFVTHILARFTVHTTQLEQGWMNTNAVSVVDLTKRRLHATFLLDDVDNGAANPWAAAVSPDGKTLYITTAGTGELHVIGLAALMDRLARYQGEPADQLSFLAGIRRRIRLPGNGPRAISLDGDAVVVREHFSRTVARVVPSDPPRIEQRADGPPPATAAHRGEMLFHDASLCFQRWQSCASCHPEGRADGLNWDLINDGIGNPKNTRSLVNSHLLPPVMWTGVRPSAGYAVRSGLRHIQFMEPPEEESRAIEAYLMSLEPEPGPAPDSASVARGRRLFFSPQVGCSACHPEPLYTDNRMRDVGTHGRFDFTTGPDGRRVPQTAFKTPSLLEVWRTGPYLHDGRYATLGEVITEGNHGDRRGRTSQLSGRQIEDLTAFLMSLPPAPGRR
jgi:mono/diheme cytochrome c family protein